ncbi:MAG: DNA polymerase III subunit delta [Chloroflexi bacterium]|nr:DNA polymerase III subunit delta [Chloroflexota bacterium]
MLYIFYGSDDFSIQEALERLKAQVGPVDVLDANFTRANVSSYSPQHLQALCNTVPFLASRRLIIADGMLALFEGRRAASKRSRGTEDASSSWLSLVEYIPTMPPSTDLVLLDGAIRRGNVLLTRLSPLGQAREFPSLSGTGLTRWVQERAASMECTISREGVRLLAELVGGNLWTLNNEIEKLSLYCKCRTVEDEDVRLLVSFVKEMSVFNAVDAILEMKYSDALRTIRHLMEDGATGSYIVSMVARQVRLLLLVKDMELRKVPQAQMGARVGLNSDWVLNKIREQGRRYSVAALESLHRGLLETDLAIKTGRIAEVAVGEFLVEVFAGVSSARRVVKQGG